MLGSVLNVLYELVNIYLKLFYEVSVVIIFVLQMILLEGERINDLFNLFSE